MNISGLDVAVFVICMAFVFVVFISKSKKHSRDHIIDRRRIRPPSPPAKK